jgi:hypothetical protein
VLDLRAEAAQHPIGGIGPGPDGGLRETQEGRQLIAHPPHPLHGGGGAGGGHQVAGDAGGVVVAEEEPLARKVQRGLDVGFLPERWR